LSISSKFRGETESENDSKSFQLGNFSHSCGYAVDELSRSLALPGRPQGQPKPIGKIRNVDKEACFPLPETASPP
jgi:hypothetical protein